MNKKVVIVSACRTAIGSLNRSLKNISAENLGAAVIKDSIAKTKIEKKEIDEIILGQVLTGGTGQNPARQAQLKQVFRWKPRLMLLIKYVVQA